MPNKDASRIKLLKGKAWLTVPQFENHLLDELGIPHGEAPMEIKNLPKDAAVYGNIVYRENFPKDVFWSRLCMEEPFMAEFSSISEAADILRSIQRNWAFVPFNCFRRAELIEKKLPFISKKLSLRCSVSRNGNLDSFKRKSNFRFGKNFKSLPSGRNFL